MENGKKKNGSALTDRDLLTDALMTEEYMTQSYNAFVNVCSTQSVRDEVTNILNNEHKIHSELLTEMQNQGWYSPRQADKEKTEQALKQFES